MFTCLVMMNELILLVEIEFTIFCCEFEIGLWLVCATSFLKYQAYSI